MDHPRQFEQEDQSPGDDVSVEEAKEVKPSVISVRGGGDGWPPRVGAEVPDARNDEENKGYNNHDQDQPALEATAGTPQLQDDADLSMICRAFSELQLRELDPVFQHAQFPDVSERKELEIPVHTEAEAESGEPGEPENEKSQELF